MKYRVKQYPLWVSVQVKKWYGWVTVKDFSEEKEVTLPSGKIRTCFDLSFSLQLANELLTKLQEK